MIFGTVGKYCNMVGWMGGHKTETLSSALHHPYVTCEIQSNQSSACS